MSSGSSEYAGLIGALLRADHLYSIGEWAGILASSINFNNFYINKISFPVFSLIFPIGKQISYTNYSPPQS